MSLNQNKTGSSTTIKLHGGEKSLHGKITLACVLGGGAYGTAMAQVVARGGCRVVIWAREHEVVEAINRTHENTAFLKGKCAHHC